MIKKNSQVSFKELRDALQTAGYTLVEKQSEDISKQKEKDIHLWRQRFIWVGLLGFPLLIFAMWEMDVSDMEKYGAAWKELVSKTESVRENNIVGLGMYTFGRGKANAYVIHSFKSHSDMSKTLSAYGENEDFQKYQKEVKPLYTDINNTVYKVIKQW